MSTKYPDLSETLFPDALDIITRMSDITYTDLDLIKQYNTYISAGNFESAQQLLADNPGLQNKIFNAEKFNKLADSIMAVQRFFKDDVETYITDVGDNLESQISQFGNVGDYSPKQSYKRFEVVRFEGSSYMCTQDCQGQPVTNPEYWVKIAEKGDTGASGAGLAFCGIYSAERQYQKDDCVSDGYRMWAALQPSVGQPLAEGEYWTCVVRMEEAPSVSVEAVLSSSAWSGDSAPYTQTISVSGMTADINGIIGIAKGASENVREAARYTALAVTGQAAGTLTISADGVLPEIDIPVSIIMWK